MEWKNVEGQWDVVKGKFKEKWGKLTDNDLMEIKGKKDVLAGKLKRGYGLAEEEAERQIDDFSKTLESEKKDRH